MVSPQELLSQFLQALLLLPQLPFVPLQRLRGVPQPLQVHLVVVLLPLQVVLLHAQLLLAAFALLLSLLQLRLQDLHPLHLPLALLLPSLLLLPLLRQQLVQLGQFLLLLLGVPLPLLLQEQVAMVTGMLQLDGLMQLDPAVLLGDDRLQDEGLILGLRC